MPNTRGFWRSRLSEFRRKWRKQPTSEIPVPKTEQEGLRERIDISPEGPLSSVRKRRKKLKGMYGQLE